MSCSRKAQDRQPPDSGFHGAFAGDRTASVNRPPSTASTASTYENQGFTSEIAGRCRPQLRRAGKDPEANGRSAAKVEAMGEGERRDLFDRAPPSLGALGALDLVGFQVFKRHETPQQLDKDRDSLVGVNGRY